MYDALIIAVLPILWILLNISSCITIFIHELGHAIPALIFTDKPVTIYIGTFGDDTSPHYTFGRLTIYIRPKLSYLKNRGLCDVSFQQQVIILAVAPVIIASLVIFLLTWLFSSDYYGYFEAFITVFLVSALINLVVNLFPKKIKVQNSDRMFYSDGYQLILFWENKANFKLVTTACRYYDEQDFGNALKYLNEIDDKYMDESIFNLKLACYVALGSYSLTKKLDKAFQAEKWYELINADDYGRLGYADIKLRDYGQALINLDKSISIDPNKFSSLHNRGIVHNILQNYEQAKIDLNKALFIDDSSSAAYSQRAYTSLKLGRPGEALNDVEKALELDGQNPYAYLAMGMYHLEKGKPKLALTNFNKAKKLDKTILFVDDYIKQNKPKTARIKAKKV
jgi:tetratricopeptide (TPR) repeat protein